MGSEGGLNRKGRKVFAKDARKNDNWPGIACVIPAHAGIQRDGLRVARLDSGLRRNDGYFVQSKKKYALKPWANMSALTGRKRVHMIFYTPLWISRFGDFKVWFSRLADKPHFFTADTKSTFLPSTILGNNHPSAHFPQQPRCNESGTA